MVEKAKKAKSKIKFEDHYVEADVAFYCCNNEVYRSVKDLCNALTNMNENTFSYHVNAEKNDFYNCQVESTRAARVKNSHGSFFDTVYS